MLCSMEEVWSKMQHLSQTYYYIKFSTSQFPQITDLLWGQWTSGYSLRSNFCVTSSGKLFANRKADTSSTDHDRHLFLRWYWSRGVDSSDGCIRGRLVSSKLAFCRRFIVAIVLSKQGRGGTVWFPNQGF